MADDEPSLPEPDMTTGVDGSRCADKNSLHSTPETFKSEFWLHHPTTLAHVSGGFDRWGWGGGVLARNAPRRRHKNPGCR